MHTDPYIIVGGIGVVMALIEIIKRLIFKDKPILTIKERVMLNRVCEILTKTDSDNVPLVYSPRSMARILRDINDNIIKLTNLQTETNNRLESLEIQRDRAQIGNS